MIGVLAYAYSMFNSILEEILRMRATKRLKQRIRGSVVTSQLPWGKLTLFWSEHPFLSQSDVTRVLRGLLRDAYSGEDPDLKPHTTLLETYVDESEAQDPLSGLPDDLRAPLEAVVQSKKMTVFELRPLLDAIHATLKESKSRSLRRNLMSLVSFVVGLAGFAFAIYAYAYPPS